jgi:t-SNARE complex subunit (syntaxin)
VSSSFGKASWAGGSARSNYWTGEGREIESRLLAEILSRLERLSDEQHRLARNHRVLIRAATQLRLGRSAETVLAEVREQCPELLRDYRDIQLTLAAAPVRSVCRIAASA